MSTNSKKQTAGTIAMVIGAAIVVGAVALSFAGADGDTGSGMSAGSLMMIAGLLMKRNTSQCSEEDAEARRE